MTSATTLTTAASPHPIQTRQGTLSRHLAPRTIIELITPINHRPRQTTLISIPLTFRHRNKPCPNNPTRQTPMLETASTNHRLFFHKMTSNNSNTISINRVHHLTHLLPFNILLTSILLKLAVHRTRLIFTLPCPIIRIIHITLQFLLTPVLIFRNLLCPPLHPLYRI